MIIVCISFFLCGFASANESELNNSGFNEISEPSIKEFANDPSFIAHRGTLPETIDQEWENSIVNCWSNLTRMGPSYSEFDISIKSVASNNEILIIELGSAYKGKVDDSKISEIYQKIDDYCRHLEGISEVPVIFMWAQDEENLPLPDYGPQIFEEVKNEPGFITTRGRMPEIHQEKEKRKWLDLLINGSQPLSRPDSTAGIKQHSAELGGPIIIFGTNINGYLRVGFEEDTPEKVNESIIDEIYQVIDKHFEQEGINEVPVVFVFDHITVAEGAPADEPGANESNDTNLSANKEKIASNKAANQMPGFTSIMVILGPLSLLVFKRSV